jgi:5,5'-dehydrodivanillate O-demethylase
MLSVEENERLTLVDRGTPMGELLRRYWMPVGAVAEFEKTSVRGVRLLGEDLVLFRDRRGEFGLIDRHCPHRRADMVNGFIEDRGLRCGYHGWLFDPTGRCLAQPYEDLAHPDARFRDKVRTAAYPVEVVAGLVWAYLGPEPRPLVPDWEPFHWENGFRQIVFADIECNWFQCQENSIDPVHFEWLHRNWTTRLSGEEGPYAPSHVRVAFEEFEYGFVYRRLQQGMSEDNPLWETGRVCLWPNALFTGSHFEWRVPVDNERTRSVTWSFTRVPTDREPYVQEGTIPAWYGPVRDPAGKWITSHVMNQDFISWTGQGVVADRTREHLGPSDEGILMLRKRFLADLDRLARGQDPKGVIRDPEANRRVALPVADYEAMTRGLDREDMLAHPFIRGFLTGGYPFQAGQPEDVRRAYEQAMGIG